MADLAFGSTRDLRSVAPAPEGGAGVAVESVTRVDTSRPPKAIRWTFTALVIAIVFGERFGVPLGSGFSLGFSLPLCYGLACVLLMKGWLAIDLRSLLIYCAIVVIGGMSYLLNTNFASGKAVSVSSLCWLLVIYAPFIFTLRHQPDSASHWLWMMRVIANSLFVTAILGMLQFYVQFVYRPAWLFDISTLIPKIVHAEGTYNSAIPVGSFFKANGVFSSEPSYFSYRMAFGLLIELALFKRVKRMLCFAIGLAVSYSGTGLLALAIGLLVSLRAAMLFRFALIALLVIGIDAAAGDPLNLAFTFSRVGEFGSQGSSAYARYIAPLRLVDENFDAAPWSAWFGNGSGMILKVASAYDSHDPTWAKLLFEYGLLGFVAFVGLMLSKMWSVRVPFQFKAVVFASWLVMGGHLSIPEVVYFLLIVVGLWPKNGSTPLDTERVP